MGWASFEVDCEEHSQDMADIASDGDGADKRKYEEKVAKLTHNDGGRLETTEARKHTRGKFECRD